MSTRNFALIGGVVMLVMGCLALVPVLNSGVDTLPVLYVNTSYGLFLDLFPMNILNKVALIIFGLAGMACYFAKDQSFRYSKIFSKTVFWVMGALAILGLFPQTNTLSGYWPLFGYEVIAHGIFAVMGGYFGYLAIREQTHHHHHHQHGLHEI
ncbi:MAG: DUF4383 domain-containing protein [Bacteriovorax sp.]|nr:DUF4383 domain-containing protein [Bacteriovorax sp.]